MENTSLTLSDFVTNLALKGIEIRLDDDGFLFEGNTKELLQEEAEFIQANESRILDYVKTKGTLATRVPALDRTPNDKAYLHYRQKNWWRAVEHGNGFSGIGYKSDFILEEVDQAVFRDAWNLLVERHDILKYGISRDENGEIYQYMRHDLKHEVEFYDLTVADELVEKINARFSDAITGGDLYSAIHGCLKSFSDIQEKETILNTNKPLYRIAVIKIAAGRHEVAFYIDHLISDGISISTIYSELQTVYDAMASKEKAVLPESKFRYIDYVNWHNKTYNEKSIWYQREKKYWLSYYSDMVPSLIPNDMDAQSGNDEDFDTVFFCFGLDCQRTAKVKAVAESNRLSLFNMLYGMAFVTLSNYIDKDRLTVATIMSGRYLPGIINLPGSFAEILFVKHTLSEGDDFITVGKNIGRELMKLQLHQNIDSTPFLPLGVSSIDSRLDRLDGSSLIFTGEFYRGLADVDDMRFTNNEITRYSLRNDTTLTPRLFWIRAFEKDGQLRLAFSFDSSRHSENKVMRLVNHYVDLVVGVTNPI